MSDLKTVNGNKMELEILQKANDLKNEITRLKDINYLIDHRVDSRGAYDTGYESIGFMKYYYGLMTNRAFQPLTIDVELSNDVLDLIYNHNKNKLEILEKQLEEL